MQYPWRLFHLVSPQMLCKQLFIGTQVGAQGIATGQFISGLRTAFTICFIFSLLAAFISYLRGPSAVWEEEEEKEEKESRVYN